MKKAPVVYPGQLTEEQIRQAQYLICCFAEEVLPHANLEVALCAAGCGDHVYFNMGYPDNLPKVCADCDEWLSDCEVA